MNRYALAVTILLPLWVGPARAETIYVSPSGRAAGPGSEARPYATLKQARDAVRSRVAQGLSEDIQVVIREGVYRQDQPLVLNTKDSGSPEHSITYAAYPGESVIVSGGRTIRGWTQETQGLWTASIPEVKRGDWHFRQLYVDGERAPRGRFPETGFLKLDGHSDDFLTLRFPGTLPPEDLGGSDTEVVVVQNWSISRELIDASDASSIKARTPVGWVGHGSCRPKPGMSVFLEHHLAFVTQPGQWYLDRNQGILHYRAAAGEDPNAREFVAPYAEQLVRIEGPVRNLIFRDLAFEHTAFGLPPIGYGGIQACYYGTTTEAAKTFAVPVALDWVGALNCRLEGCRFRRLGGSGLGLGARCRGNQVVGCHFTDIGGTGINVGHMPVKDPLWVDWEDPADAPAANTIENCLIEHCGVELWGAHGIFDAMTRSTSIHHNEVRHQPYGGIATGYRWGTELTTQQGCLIASNHVYEVMERLYDSGAVYTLGYQPGSVIQGNHLHGVRRSGYAGGAAANNGIFFDEGSKGFTLIDNVIYDISEKPIRFNRSQKDWQTWTNNSFNIAPGDPGFPADIADRAGLQEPYRKRFH